MKLDKTYSYIYECPETKQKMSYDDIHCSGGVCPYCGDHNSIEAHNDQIVGRWRRPSLFERIFKLKKSEFLRKEDEDKTWETLNK